MTKEEQIKDWFIHQFWPIYPSKWCRNGKGSRQQALNSMLKHDPDEQERMRILSNLKAQVRADKGNQNRKWWVIGVTYVNNQMWEDTIEVEETEVRDAKYCQCGAEVHGPRYTECTDHVMEKHGDKLGKTSQATLRKQALKDIGLPVQGVSLSELANLCREYMLKPGNSDYLKKLNKSPDC